LPVGGDDLHQAGETLELRPATGTERFAPLNDPEKSESPDPGEIIYVVAETQEIMCRRWNWRNGFNTRITEDTEAIVMNIDGLGEDNESRTILVRDRVARMLHEFCGAEVATALLTQADPLFEFQL
jgi:DNA/RNA-binding domain of Phe-tRNA-synthetase-like protein